MTTKKSLFPTLVAGVVLAMASAANATILVGGEDGWKVSFGSNFGQSLMAEALGPQQGNIQSEDPSLFGLTALRSTAATNFESSYGTELSYISSFENGNIILWLSSGSYLGVERSNTNALAAERYAFGGKLNLGAFEAIGFYYNDENRGFSSNLNTLTTLNETNEKHDAEGYLVQAGYNFGDASGLTVSYGQSELARTQNDLIYLPTNLIEKQRSTTVGLYHDVSSNLRMVAEFTSQEDEWHGGGEIDAGTFSVGGHFSW